MKINCISCGRDINLDHDVFNDYQGSIKCFSCDAMMEIKARGGVLDSINLSRTPPESLTDPVVERTL